MAPAEGSSVYLWTKNQTSSNENVSIFCVISIRRNWNTHVLPTKWVGETRQFLTIFHYSHLWYQCTNLNDTQALQSHHEERGVRVLQKPFHCNPITMNVASGSSKNLSITIPSQRTWRPGPSKTFPLKSHHEERGVRVLQKPFHCTSNLSIDLKISNCFVRSGSVLPQ